MVFVIVQIRSGATILKTWYGCSIPEGSSLTDVYTSFSSGQLDHGLPIPEEYQDSTVVVKVGKSRSDLIIVSIECSVAEVVSNLGQYMDFAVGMGIQGAVQDQSTARPVSSSTNLQARIILEPNPMVCRLLQVLSMLRMWEQSFNVLSARNGD